ncbi:hypothetical protein [Burkholderia sp. USMB20]|uniref:hypothetical protein n=1 Tax=Burkholderia sp. USMB20 TaxID=1571773 RepID=UPI000AE73372|nr:hypothetical protein [Burkholderia sp. USMB20]TGN99215.1 hypothetical protein PL79_000670 [Burkholderia sp. USMB20]
MNKAKYTSIYQQPEGSRQRLRRHVRAGDLLIAPFFARRLGINMQQLARRERSGSVFSVDVDGTPYYPAFFTSPGYNQRRLRKLCRLIFPAPAVARWEYLTTKWGALNDRTPLEAMQTEGGFARLLAIAKFWAAQWWRTTVEIRRDAAGEADAESSAPVCMGTVEIDPGEAVWHRAAEALRYCGNLRPTGPYPRLDAMTVVVTKCAGGDSEPLHEVKFEVRVLGGVGYARVVSSSVELTRLRPVPIDVTDDVVAIVRKLLAAAEPMSRHGR